MKSFLAIFTCAENSKNHEAWKQLDPQTQAERMKKGMAAKHQWEEKYKNQIIYDGGPLGEKTKKVSFQGIHDTPSIVGAFVVIEAKSHDEAAKIFLDHPHFAIFPGDGIDIIERADRFEADL